MTYLGFGHFAALPRLETLRSSWVFSPRDAPHIGVISLSPRTNVWMLALSRDCYQLADAEADGRLLSLCVTCEPARGRVASR